jgi:hypothetical protein
MRASFLPAFLLTVALTGFGHCPLLAESVSRSDPQTEGERRLLEWDTTRKFVPSKSTFAPSSLSGSKTVSVNPFATRSFTSKVSVPPSSFFTSEFLSPTAPSGSKSFATQAAQVSKASAFEKPFDSGKSNADSKPFSTSPAKAELTKATADSTRPFLGPEAEKARQKNSPLTGPKGGYSTGHQLTVEEVREILNRNK